LLNLSKIVHIFNIGCEIKKKISLKNSSTARPGGTILSLELLDGRKMSGAYFNKNNKKFQQTLSFTFSTTSQTLDGNGMTFEKLFINY